MANPMYFLEVELTNVRPFASTSMLNLSDRKGNWLQWTVILGDNGTGKTTLLKALASLELMNPKLGPVAFKLWYGNNKNYFQEDFFINLPFLPLPPGNINFVSSIKANLFNSLRNEPFSSHDLTIEYGKGGCSYGGASYFNATHGFPIYSYGASRIIGSGNLSENTSKESNTLFDEYSRLINAEEWLMQLDYAASKESAIKEFAIKKRDQVINSLIKLLPDINGIRFTAPTKESLTPRVEFCNSFGWVPIENLSLGYKSMVGWIVDLAARMFSRYSDSIDPLSEPAIVLVDEIDLHLHPKWQRMIFQFLSERFINTQFIVTSHSPLIAQSAPENSNIIVLRKNEDYVVIDDEKESVHNWRIDQIMSSDLFDIDSSRSLEVEKWIRERNELLQKTDLSERDRLRLSELNSKVHSLPTERDEIDNEAMDIIRKAADFIKNKS